MADIDPAVLLLLRGVVGERVHYFAQASWIYESKEWSGYLAVGDSALHYVTQTLSKEHTGLRIEYEALAGAVVCENTSEQLIVFSKLGAWNWAASFWNWIRDGAMLLSLVQVAYLTYHLERLHTVKTLDVRRQRAFPTDVRDLFATHIAELVLFNAWKKWRKIGQAGFDYFVPQDWRSLGTGVFTSQGLTVYVDIHLPQPTDRYSFRQLVQDVCSEFASTYEGLIIHSSTNVIKRMNMAGDSAVWRMREICAEHNHGVIVAYVIRRSKCPPLRESAQNILVVGEADLVAYFGDSEDSENSDAPPRRTLKTLRQEVQSVADSMAPTRGLVVPYNDLIECKTDCLLYPPETTNWLAYRFHVKPHALSVLMPLFRIIVLELIPAKCGVGENLRSLMLRQTKSQVDQDLHGIEICDKLRAMLELLAYNPQSEVYCGIDPLNQKAMYMELRHLQLARLAEFVGEMLDGALGGTGLRLEHLFKAVEHVDDFGRQAINELTAFIIHPRPTDMSLPYTPKSTWMEVLSVLVYNQTKAACFTNAQMWRILEEFRPSRRLSVVNSGQWTLNGRQLAKMVKREHSPYLIPIITRDLRMAPAEACLKLQTMCMSGVVLSMESKELIMDDLIVYATYDDHKSDHELTRTYATPCAVSMLSLCRITPRSVEMLRRALAIIAKVLLDKSTSLEARYYCSDRETCECLAWVFGEWNKLDFVIVDACLRVCHKISKDRNGKERLVAGGVVPALVNMLSVLYDHSDDKYKRECALICQLLGDLSSLPSVKDLFCTRLPVLDFVLYVFHMYETEGDFERMGRMIHCLRKLLAMDPRLVVQIGRHATESLMYSMVTAGTRDFVLASAELLQALAADTATRKQLADKNALASVHDFMENYWSDDAEIMDAWRAFHAGA